MFQYDGPIGSGKSPRATKKPSSSTVIGSWGSGRTAGPKTGLAPCVTSNYDWWHGQRIRLVSCSYNDTGQPAWVQIFEYAT